MAEFLLLLFIIIFPQVSPATLAQVFYSAKVKEETGQM
jgi:hypothetical protein